MSVSRRGFLQQSILLGVASAFNTGHLQAATGTGPGFENPGWFDRPMRWAQLTLVENDPPQYDLEFWLDYFKRVHADAACLSAGGCVAYYPTKIPLHHRSDWMGDSDPFGDLLKGCRSMNMVVIARTDPHSVRQDVYEAHPDWIAVDAEGRRRRHWATPERWVSCGLGPYNFEFMTKVHKEIVSLYRVDGIFVNRWAGSGMCYCQQCQKNFRDAYGMELPRTRDPQDPGRRSYLLWRQKRLFELWRLWDAEIRRINPKARCIPNTGGGALSSLDMKSIGELAETLMADRQGRRGLMAPWGSGKNAKEYRATMGRKPIVGIFSVGLVEPYRWKDSVQNDAEIRIWVADGIANGLRPWFTKFSGTLYDKRWLDVVEDIYKWHHGVERYLRNEKSLARVAIVYSQQTGWFYGGPEARQKVEDHTLGLYHALIEGRIPFEMVHDRLLDPEHIGQFRTLILPNIAALSLEQCQQLRDYVKRGGSLVATFETSLYDEWGVQRSDFELADVFGVWFKGRVQRRMQNSYLRLEKDPTTGKFHPILAGLEDTSRIINGVQRVDVGPRQKYLNPPLTLIPSYPDLPMEEVYPRVLNSGIPEVYLREVGRSRIVYFPWDIDRTFWEVMCVDHGKLIGNAVKWASNEEEPVTVTGRGVLDVTMWRQKDSMTVHLVNLTNPMMMKGPFRELIAIGEQKVRVRLPEGKKPKKVHLLVSGQSPQVQESAGYVSLTVPSIRDHEVVAIDL
ncbi:beta-galactosidase trimerization domain-containing protein [Acidobacteria bacterium AH-259-G07]|nr:beta-galactosidase trimerization domain-containing protein [Acidobacteria bacterium AH-259-G07]